MIPRGMVDTGTVTGGWGESGSRYSDAIEGSLAVLQTTNVGTITFLKSVLACNDSPQRIIGL